MAGATRAIVRCGGKGHRLRRGSRDPRHLSPVRSTTGTHANVCVDVSDQMTVEDAVARAGDRIGRVDIAINCTGILSAALPEEFGRLVCHIVENDYVNATMIGLDRGIRLGTQ